MNGEKKNYAKWNDPKDKDFELLDDLDKVSVSLHREYARCAKKKKRENVILQSDIDVINKLLEGNAKKQEMHLTSSISVCRK